MEAKVRLTDIATLIKVGHDENEKRHDESEKRLSDIQMDLDRKHQENRDHRHRLANELQLFKDQMYLLATRVSNAETTLLTIVGDNTGGSGLLHSIDHKVDKLQEEFSAWKTEVRDNPSIRKWVYGAIAVCGFLAVTVPIALLILFEVLKQFQK